MYYAVYLNEIDKIKELIKNKADVNEIWVRIEDDYSLGLELSLQKIFFWKNKQL